MPGSHYIALSGLRARVDELDRLAADIANVGTVGYKSTRDARAAAERDAFGAALETAIDTTHGGRRLDTTAGALAQTGRALDLAVDGGGFFVISTPAGERYSRDGSFSIGADRQLVNRAGNAVQGVGGSPITIDEDGEIKVDADGTVWAGTTKAGQVAIVDFADRGGLVNEHGSLLRADGQTATPVAHPVVRSGSLEQSNVSMADRMASLTSVSRGFEALQKALSLMMNDVDGRAIDHLGRR
jgi:flagellar basal body rod protein FlgG